MRLAALTGGIGTGKSVVSLMFADMGAKIVDADAIAHDIVRIDEPAYNDIVDHFGKAILDPNGDIDREKLGAIIFNDDSQRRVLNSMTHPRVFEEMQHRITMHMVRGAELVVCDVPLLMESGARNWLRPVILVYADPTTQLNRLMKRDGCDEERARSRISSQMPIDEKKQHADIVIDNSGTLDDTRAQVEQAYRDIMAGKYTVAG